MNLESYKKMLNKLPMNSIFTLITKKEHKGSFYSDLKNHPDIPIYLNGATMCARYDRKILYLNSYKEKDIVCICGYITHQITPERYRQVHGKIKKIVSNKDLYPSEHSYCFTYKNQVPYITSNIHTTLAQEQS